VSISQRVHWINNTDHKHIAVVRYDSDLNSKLPRLLAGLGIPDKGVTLSRLNVSVDNKRTTSVIRRTRIRG
jgi:hypothetical protein